MGVADDKPGSRARTVASVVGFTLVGIVLYMALLAGLSPDPATDLDQTIGPVRLQDVELQVAVHDLVEEAGPGTVIGVCRAVASERVSLDVATGSRLRDALEELGSQVHTELVMRAGSRVRGAVPTLSCPSGTGDYLEIGRGEPSP